jgi:hypothetical protein
MDSQMDRRHVIQVVFPALLVLGMFGAYLVIRATPFGLGLRDDSFRYLSAAENLAGGSGYGRWDAEGLFQPLTNFPPLFSSLLAAFEMVGFQAYRGARATNVLFFAGLIMLIGASLYFGTSSAWAAVIGTPFVAFSASMISTYTWVMSEPLSNLLVMLGLICITLYLIRPDSRRTLLLLIVISALAFLSRFANLAVGATCVIAILLFSNRPIRKRVTDSVAYIFLSTLPLSLFLLRNVLTAGSLSNRPAPFFHLPEVSVLEQGTATILRWFLLDSVAEYLKPTMAHVMAISVIAIIIVGGFSIFILHPRRIAKNDLRHRPYMGTVAWLFFIVYMGLLAVTLIWFDRLLPLSDRILSPLYFSGLLVLSGLLVSVARTGGRRVSVFLLFVATICFAAKVNDALSFVGELREDGLGFASVEWRTSRTIAYLEGLPDVPIYSNDIPAAYLLAGRIVHSIPISMNPSSLENNPKFQAEVNQMRHDLLFEDGYLVLIGSDPLRRVGSQSLSTFTQGLELEATFPDGAVFHANRD